MNHPLRHLRILMVYSLLLKMLLSAHAETLFQPFIVFHAHVLHEFGAGLHARKRPCVLERLLVILGIGDGYFARHVIPVDHLETLDHLQAERLARLLRMIDDQRLCASTMQFEL